MNLEFVPITHENIILATEIQMQLFPDMCAYLEYEKRIEQKEPHWLVYHKNDLIGTVGVYGCPWLKEEKTCWLGWFGVLPKYRNKGYGTVILQKLFEIAKNMGYETLRVYTSYKYCPLAISFYDRLMDFHEIYTYEKFDYEVRIYTKSLTDKPAKKLGHKNIYIKSEIESEKEGLMQFEKLKEINKKSN